MKKVWIVTLICLGMQFTFAQNDTKDTYVLNGDTIEAVMYHDNGVIAQEGTYTKEGVIDGKWISYDVNGKISAIANYQNGKKVGEWTFFSGDVKKVVTYENSKIASVRTWQLTDTRVVSN